MEMATAGTEWDLQLQRAGQLVQDISYELAERDGMRRAGGAPGDLAGKIRAHLTNLDRQLETLDQGLREQEANPARFRLAPKDITARRENLRKLQNERTRLRGLERTAGTGGDRTALLATGDGRSYGRETELTRDMTTQQMLAHTQSEEKAQDAILGQMAKNLDNLKTMGVAIKDETALHMKLLDGLESEIDKGNANLKRETARVEHVTRDANTFWLYTAICILLGVLIALVLIKWH